MPSIAARARWAVVVPRVKNMDAYKMPLPTNRATLEIIVSRGGFAPETGMKVGQRFRGRWGIVVLDPYIEMVFLTEGPVVHGSQQLNADASSIGHGEVDDRSRTRTLHTCIVE